MSGQNLTLFDQLLNGSESTGKIVGRGDGRNIHSDAAYHLGKAATTQTELIAAHIHINDLAATMFQSGRNHLLHIGNLSGRGDNHRTRRIHLFAILIFLGHGQ